MRFRIPRPLGGVIDSMGKMRKIAIGIVTYNPNKTLISRLELAITSGFFLYIFDNSPENINVREFCNKQINTKYITCGKNVGLGFGISSVCAQAYYDSYSALIFFDQDTVFEKSTLDFIEDFYTCNPHLSDSYSAIVFNSKNIGNESIACDSNRFIFKDVLMAINSGSLYFLENLKKINWHNETYFVDCVDYEFCLNSNNSDLKIGECSLAPGFDHETEQGDDKYTIFGETYSVRKYSMGRMIDSIFASLRLLISSIKTKNFSFAIKISRLLAGYLVYQLMVRVINSSKFKKPEAL
jgi:hypothetical protein